ncbi:DUF3558 domain-containing protein [Amycolatopsis sp. NPDC051045]|uniref:DUF3558 domain-containing protein n=1 Tax=Amycolatopsis sp. NPDC051045 TaxID=3156922 RepID=UPI0034330353
MRAKTMAVVGLAFLLAGCSTGVAGKPSPVASASPSDVGGAGVPKVSRPLDVSRFEKEPCVVLTPEQLAEFGITRQPKSMPEDALGPSCTWNGLDEGGVTVGTRFLSSGSLAGLYKKHEQGGLPYFQPVADIAGYPGVLTDLLDVQPQGKCSAEVAVSDDRLYSVQVTISSDAKDYANPCPVAQKAAELAVSTMKAGA